MGYRRGIEIGWRETGNGGCGWSVALGGVPWCLYGKAGGLTHTRVIALIAPPSPQASLQATPQHLSTSAAGKWSGPCPAPRRHTRPRDLPALPLPSCIAACASWNSGHSLDELVLDGSCVGCPPASPGALSPPTGRCDFTRIHLSPDSDGFPTLPCIRSTIQQVDITLHSQSHSLGQARQSFVAQRRPHGTLIEDRTVTSTSRPPSLLCSDAQPRFRSLLCFDCCRRGFVASGSILCMFRPNPHFRWAADRHAQ